jgi:hypothetical protein
MIHSSYITYIGFDGDDGYPDDIIDALRKYKNVKYLDFVSNKPVLPALLKIFKTLRSVHIQQCDIATIVLDNNSIDELVINDCAKLESINIKSKRNRFIKFVCNDCPLIKTIPLPILLHPDVLNHITCTNCSIKSIPAELVHAMRTLRVFNINNSDGTNPKLPDLTDWIKNPELSTNIPELAALSPDTRTPPIQVEPYDLFNPKLTPLPLVFDKLNWNTSEYKFVKKRLHANNSNKNTVLNINSFLSDNLITTVTKNPTPNKYLIHYEEYDGVPYPIITIPKGTMLFTGRETTGSNEPESFSYLYKLNSGGESHPTLESYRATNYENALTYFFPLPYMINVVNGAFKRIDVVTCSHDIRLLCLISPAPISRIVRSADYTKGALSDTNGDPVYLNSPQHMHSCSSRDYDLCLTNELLRGLKLNGYIGMPHGDALSTEYSHFEQIMKQDGMDVKQSGLYQSCIFNAETFSFDNVTTATFNHAHSLLELANLRTYGIPEIVLIPFDIHNSANEYETIYKEFMKDVTNDKPPDVNPTGFIFKPWNNVESTDTLSVVKKVELLLTAHNTEFVKSLQSFPLFSAVKTEIDSENPLFIDPTIGIAAQDCVFMDAYTTNGGKSKCAFETMFLYKALYKGFHDIGMTIVGGRTALRTYHQPMHHQTMHHPTMNTKRRIAPKKTEENKMNTLIDRFLKIRMHINNEETGVTVDKPGFYYSDKSGFPILYMEKQNNMSKSLSSRHSSSRHSSNRKGIKRDNNTSVSRRKHKQGVGSNKTHK